MLRISSREMFPAAGIDLFRRYFSIFVWKRDHFMSGRLDCAGLMHVDMPGIGGDHALPRS